MTLGAAFREVVAQNPQTEFKAPVAMEAISGRKTFQEIAADHAIHPIRMSQWEKQLLEGAGDLYPSGEAFGYLCHESNVLYEH